MVVLLCLWCASTPAFAEETTSDEQATIPVVKAGKTDKTDKAPKPAHTESESDTTEDEQVTVRAKRIVQAYDNARSVDVVSTETAQRAVASDVGAMLAEVGGVTVQKTTPASAVPILRGVTGNRVLTVFHDIRLNDALTRAGGNELLRLVDPESVYAVEVVRGPGSVRYGSDALGGVIRIVPADVLPSRKQVSTWGSSVQMRGSSSNGGLQTRAHVTGRTPWVGLRLSGTFGRFGDMSAGGGGSQPYTSYSEHAESVRLAFPLGRKHTLGVAGHSVQVLDTSRPAKSKPGDLRQLPLNAKETVYVWYQAKGIGQGVTLNTRTGISRRRAQRARIRDEGTDEFEEDEVRALFLRAELEKVWWPGPELIIGLDAELESVASSASEVSDNVRRERPRGRYIDGSQYNILGVFSLLQHTVTDALQLAVGARGSMIMLNAPRDPLFLTQGKTQSSTREWAATLGGTYNFTEALSISLNGLRGFRSPNLEDLHALGEGSRGYSVPPTTLKPELSTTVEFGISHHSERLQLRSYVYRTVLDDEIVRVPTTFMGETQRDGSPYITRANASETELLGLEFSGRIRISHIWIGAGLSGTRGETTHNGGTRPAAKIPPISGQATIGYTAPKKTWWIEVVGRGESSQSRLSEADKQDVRICYSQDLGCAETTGYFAIDLRGGYRMGRFANLSIELENLLDTAYHSFASGIEGSGFGINGSLRLTY
jgi:hemoglobin/transferrin/lactoferrin receptor protein